MPPYQWTWGWHAVTQWKKEPFTITEEQIDEWVKEKVVQKLVAEYVKKDYSISVTSVNTTSKITFERRPPTRIMPPRIRYFVDAETTTEFDTDAPVLGSPIEPVTLAIIASVISAVIGLATVVFYFLTFRTVTNMIYDIGTGVGEVIGVEGFGGLGILFILILGIVLLYVVGKYFWKRRK